MNLGLLVLFVLSLIDVIFFIFTLIFPSFMWLFITFHVLSYMIVYFIKHKKLNDYKGLPLYVYLFMPGIGPIIIFSVYMGLYKIPTNTLLIEDYENYIRFQKSHKFEKKFEFDEVIKTLPAIDYLTHFGTDQKKQLIATSGNNLSSGRVHILREGSKDYDTEVQHYAATTLNKVEADVNQEMHTLHNNLSETNDKIVLVKLLKLYKNYLESTLISEENIGIYNKRYIDLLIDSEERLGTNFNYSMELLRCYIRGHDDALANSKYLELNQLYPEKIELKLIKIEIDIKFSSIESLSDDIRSLQILYSKNSDILDDRLRNQVKYWLDESTYDMSYSNHIKTTSIRLSSAVKKYRETYQNMAYFKYLTAHIDSKVKSYKATLTNGLDSILEKAQIQIDSE